MEQGGWIVTFGDTASICVQSLKDVCTRPKFARLLSAVQVSDFTQILHNRLTFVETHSNVQACRDPEDDYLLVICLDGEAEYLITRDNDLLSLRSFEKIRILTLTEFEQVL